MKIVQVTAIDGTMHHLLNKLNKTSKENNFEVHCICSEGENKKYIIDEGYKLHNIDIDRKISIIKNIKTIIRLSKLIKEIKPDIVHVHTPVAAVLGRIAAKIAKVPIVIYTAHGFYFHDGMSKNKYKIYFLIEKYIGRYFTDYIFTQSKEDYQTAKDNKFLKNNDNFLHISNGIDLDDKFNINKYTSKDNDNLRRKLGIPKNDIVVTFIGRQVKEKGIFELLEGFQNIESKNVKLIIIGNLPQGERDTTTIKEINKYKENKNIIFTGKINNVNDYLYMSDIFCLPSYREGMPRSIIEAMAMGNAILATNIRGSREEVDHGLNGYLFDVKSSKEIGKYIDILANNLEKIEEFKIKGIQKARENYDENKVVQKQIQIFKETYNKLGKEKK